MTILADLLVAVSFGLFIPPNIIQAVPSSVNIHPSLLPKYRGPAPIHNAIYNGDENTGVSIQTISSEAFDKGIVFAQSQPLPIGENDTLTEIWDRLAEIGADMLVNCIRQKTYLNPTPIEPSKEASYARPINKTIDWHKVTADQAVQLGKIFDPRTGAVSLKDGHRKDIVVSGIHHRRRKETKLVPGSFFLTRYWQTGDPKMVVVCSDGETVWVDKVKVAGKTWTSSPDFVQSASHRFWGSRFVPWRREFEDHDPKEFEY
jgi:methionyl-tRNA formyltransferase